MAEQCEMIIGYLVPHRCENPSLGTCVKCRRGYCDEHTNQTSAGRYVWASSRDLTSPSLYPLVGTFTAAELTRSNVPVCGMTMTAGYVF
jgi:hypothetical protein